MTNANPEEIPQALIEIPDPAPQPENKAEQNIDLPMDNQPEEQKINFLPNFNNIPSIKKRQPRTKKQILEENPMQILRHKFNLSLSKLNDNDAREVGKKELKQIIEMNVTHEALRIFLNSLSETHRVASANGKAAQIELYGIIASTFKKDMIDPIDKPPNLLKTISRLCEFMLRYLKVNNLI